MEFPHHPYQPVPINGFSYPTVAELEEHVEERVRGDSDRNLIRMWLPDQVWTQHRIEQGRYGYAQGWPEWANGLVQDAYRPGGATMSGGRAFQGAVLLSNENRRRVVTSERRLDER